ncbi:MAG: PstS family phosphate ABC transporter substrate-binding protein [Lentisphaerae bacterium]|nr:PstS family phosphate ABC transporter substrate-binding protein [Lentisphaerota bacterium]
MRKSLAGRLAAGFVGLAACAAAQPDLEGTLSLSGAWALYPMAVRWGEEFGKLHPGVRFDVSAGGAGKGMTDVLAGAVDIGLVSREIGEAERNKGALPIAVTKDAVIPMINAANPALAQLAARGVKREVFEGIWIRGDVTTWGQAAGSELKAPIRVYTRSDACGAAQTWAQYLGGSRQEDLKGIGVYGDPGLGEAVRRDPLGIGYNNVNFAYDAKTGKPVAGLAVLPIDVNGNGTLDAEENVYATQAGLMAAIAGGAFPSPPARDLYFVTRGKPAQRSLAAEFVRWVLTDGQKYVTESGYVPLSAEQLKSGLKAVQEE